MLTPNSILQDRYRIIRQLGQGGMGTVYEAIDQRFDSQVALKETHFNDELLRKQFEREARLLNKLRHPAMTRVIDHFSEKDGQFLVMDFVAGEELGELLKQRGRAFPVAHVLNWADQLLDALDYLHNQRPPIVHRDIKPQNLKLSNTGQIILLDFGLAKGFAGQTSRVTTSGSIFGYTPNYAPLEQIQGTGTDTRCDLYSLAATMYHLVTGVIPPDALARATANVSDQPDPLLNASEANPQVPVAVASVLAQAMALNPGKRFASPAEMRVALRHASETSISTNADAATLLMPQVEAAPPKKKKQAAPLGPTVMPSAEQKATDFPSTRLPATLAAATVASPVAPPPEPTQKTLLSAGGLSSQPRAVAQQPRKKSYRLPLIIGIVVTLLVVVVVVTSIAIITRPKPVVSHGVSHPIITAAQLAKEGDELEEQSKDAEAEAKFREAIKLEPSNPEWQDDLRNALLNQNKLSDAVQVANALEAVAREAISSDPNNAKFHVFLGAALRQQKRFDESEVELRQAVRLDPKDALAHEYLGITRFRQGKSEEAEAEYKEAVRLDPNDFWKQVFLGDQLLMHDKIVEAETPIREAVRLAPGAYYPHVLLADWLFAQRRNPESEAEYREALRLQPNDGDYHFRLGKTLAAQGKLKEAEAEMQEAVRLNPNDGYLKEGLQQLRVKNHRK